MKMHNNTAFTKLELLIALTILLVLSIVLVMLINPKDKLALSRDSGRVMNVAQLGRTMVAYYAGRGSLPAASTWLEDVISFAQFKKPPGGIRYRSFGVESCHKNEKPGSIPTYCYDIDSTGNKGAIVYTRMESWSQNKKCIGAGKQTYFVFSTGEGQAGFVCANSDPSPWTPGSGPYVD